MIIDQAKGDGLLTEYLDKVQKVLLIFNHGLGDMTMFRAPFLSLQKLYPHIQFFVGMARNKGQESLIVNAVPISGNWKNLEKDYDLIYFCHFPMENTHDSSKTKAEICCLKELGIPPVSEHLAIKPKPLVACHFQITSVPELAGAEEKVAKIIWEDIKQTCTPIEVHFEHSFHNPVNKKFDFVDFHVRNCPAKLDHLISLIASCHAFVGVVSGPFHLALSILPYKRVFLLEKKLKAGHFTKLPIATASLTNYKNEVRDWLNSL